MPSFSPQYWLAITFTHTSLEPLLALHPDNLEAVCGVVMIASIYLKRFCIQVQFRFDICQYPSVYHKTLANYGSSCRYLKQ